MTGPEPRTPADHGAFEELAVGYALHALEPDDELRFDTHLAGCRACAAAVAAHEETLAALALSCAAEPPPGVLAGIRAGVAASGAARERVPAPVADLGAARRRRSAVAVRRSWLLSAAAAVIAVVVLGLGAWNGVLRSDLGEQRSRADRLAATVATLESPGAKTVRLADFSGDVQVVAIASGQRMSLVVDGLAPNPDDTVYVVWGQTTSGDVRALTTFDVDGQGLDVLQGLPMQLPLEQLDALMITREPGRTPPAQTRQPVLVAGSV